MNYRLFLQITCQRQMYPCLLKCKKGDIRCIRNFDLIWTRVTFLFTWFYFSTNMQWLYIELTLLKHCTCIKKPIDSQFLSNLNKFFFLKIYIFPFKKKTNVFRYAFSPLVINMAPWRIWLTQKIPLSSFILPSYDVKHTPTPNIDQVFFLGYLIYVRYEFKIHHKITWLYIN